MSAEKRFEETYKINVLDALQINIKEKKFIGAILLVRNNIKDIPFEDFRNLLCSLEFSSSCVVENDVFYYSVFEANQNGGFFRKVRQEDISDCSNEEKNFLSSGGIKRTLASSFVENCNYKLSEGDQSQLIDIFYFKGNFLAKLSKSLIKKGQLDFNGLSYVVKNGNVSFGAKESILKAFENAGVTDDLKDKVKKLRKRYALSFEENILKSSENTKVTDDSKSKAHDISKKRSRDSKSDENDEKIVEKKRKTEANQVASASPSLSFVASSISTVLPDFKIAK